ncbi:uncharacterized protein H6S33_005713 [Morchella sextelata]|uniref:uncharacterized protein n=1 Tax=Morchella sextelata TaxID=1174677 RepID=UPI001D03D691|nr:uncharacterized protein H6S33_005713 [Morchella sextelata]KAH0613827.1 hypothetical protein H6S33_005713 [Morchella sextelata]
MRFVTIALLATAATCKAVGSVENSRDSLAVQDVLVQRYNAFDNSNIADLELPKDLHFQSTQQTVQVQTHENQTSAPEVQKRTDSSTPGTKIMSTWRQVVGGIAVAVLVAVI